MDSKTLTKDMTLRMELGIEIEERISARYNEKIEKLTATNQQLDQRVGELLASQEQLSTETILKSEHQSITMALTSKLSGLENEIAELKKKHDALRDQSSKVKAEHAEFKRLDPAGMKKKLDESKKKLKVKTQAVADMTKDKVKLNDTIAGLKREVETLKKSEEAE